MKRRKDNRAYLIISTKSTTNYLFRTDGLFVLI